jgi:hypothetical protein
MQKFPRTDKPNESYYAKNNMPTFSQFKDYHFVDEQHRQYTIANDNSDAFQNKRLRLAPDTNRCVVNQYDDIKLFVKLPRNLDWFSEIDAGRPLTLRSRDGTDSYTIVLKGSIQGDRTRRTGTIFVSGLTPMTCNKLLSL